MKIFVLTGAGISAESGISTFRDAGGLWEGHAIEEVATPEGFEANPGLVYQFYNLRRDQLFEVEPNAAHRALVELEKREGVELTLVTQNVDDLHERAGNREVIHMHGELRQAKCLVCGKSYRWSADLGAGDRCENCGGRMRPDIVWFGEMPYEMDLIESRLGEADLFIAVGTSGQVYPAAGYADMARRRGIPTIEFNLEPTDQSGRFSESICGKAGDTLPEWVREFEG